MDELRRFVIDPNVLVSAAIADGVPGVVEEADAGICELSLSDRDV